MYFIAVKKKQDNFIYVNGVSFVILTKCDSEGVLFPSKLVYKRVRGWTAGRSPTLPYPTQFFIPQILSKNDWLTIGPQYRLHRPVEA